MPIVQYDFTSFVTDLKSELESIINLNTFQATNQQVEDFYRCTGYQGNDTPQIDITVNTPPGIPSDHIPFLQSWFLSHPNIYQFGEKTDYMSVLYDDLITFNNDQSLTDIIVNDLDSWIGQPGSFTYTGSQVRYNSMINFFLNLLLPTLTDPYQLPKCIWEFISGINNNMNQSVQSYTDQIILAYPENNNPVINVSYNIGQPPQEPKTLKSRNLTIGEIITRLFK